MGTSLWLEQVIFVKQIQTANICLIVERYCISVILRAKVGEKSWIPPLHRLSLFRYDCFPFQADTESRRNQLMRDMAQLRLQVN